MHLYNRNTEGLRTRCRCLSGFICAVTLSTAAFLFSSCESLPEGEPPEGPIVTIENSADQFMPLKAAINQMVTVLATSADLSTGKDKTLTNVIPGQMTVPEKYSAQLAMSPTNVYSELLTMEILDADPTRPTDYILSSTFVKLLNPPPEVRGKSVFRWEMSLTRPGASKPDWTHSLKICLEQ